MRPPQESPPESPKSLRSTNSAGKQVCFDKVEIIEFPYQLGDNPAVKSGAPVTIGWESHTRAKFEIDYFEVFEKGERTDLSLSPTQRTKLLLALGYSQNEIDQSALQCEKIKKEREASIKNVKWDRVNLAMNAAGKTLRKILPGKSGSSGHKASSSVTARSA